MPQGALLSNLAFLFDVLGAEVTGRYPKLQLDELVRAQSLTLIFIPGLNISSFTVSWTADDIFSCMPNFHLRSLESSPCKVPVLILPLLFGDACRSCSVSRCDVFTALRLQRRVAEGAAMLRTKGEAGTGNVVEAVRHARSVQREIKMVSKLMVDRSVRLIGPFSQVTQSLLVSRKFEYRQPHLHAFTWTPVSTHTSGVPGCQHGRGRAICLREEHPGTVLPRAGEHGHPGCRQCVHRAARRIPCRSAQ